MTNLKTRIVALLMISLLAITFAPTASAKVLNGPCDGAVGLANCAAEQAGCDAYYILYGQDRCQSDVATTIGAPVAALRVESE